MEFFTVKAAWEQGTRKKIRYQSPTFSVVHCCALAEPRLSVMHPTAINTPGTLFRGTSLSHFFRINLSITVPSATQHLFQKRYPNL